MTRKVGGGRRESGGEGGERRRYDEGGVCYEKGNEGEGR